jgi:hypothetical protein
LEIANAKECDDEEKLVTKGIPGAGSFKNTNEASNAILKTGLPLLMIDPESEDAND